MVNVTNCYKHGVDKLVLGALLMAAMVMVPALNPSDAPGYNFLGVDDSAVHMGRSRPVTLSPNERYCQNVTELMAAVSDTAVNTVYLEATDYILTKAISLNRSFSFYGPVNGTAYIVSKIGYRHILLAPQDIALAFDGVVLDGRQSVIGGYTINGGIENIAVDVTLGPPPTGSIPINMPVYTISGAVITGCSASDGGGLRINANMNTGIARVYLNGCFITDNNAVNGGGLYADTNVILTMLGGMISRNTATVNGGGVYNRGSFRMSNGTISDNKAEGNGGGLFINSAFMRDVSIQSGAISGNIARDGGGVYVSSNCTLDILSIVLNGNTATASGGGIYNRGTARISSGTISGNNAALDGGGIYTTDYANLTTSSSVAGIIFLNNSARRAYALDINSVDYTTIYLSQIRHSPQSWTEPFEYGYNNYDINYTRGNSLAIVTFDANGGVFGDSKPHKIQSVPQNGAFGANMPPNPENSGHIFSNWNTMPNGSGNLFTSETTVVNDITTYAVWVPAYTVTINDGYAHNPDTQAYAAGDVVVIDAGSRAGYIFAKWAVIEGDIVMANPNSSTTNFIMPAENVIIAANWVLESPATSTTTPPTTTTTTTETWPTTPLPTSIATTTVPLITTPTTSANTQTPAETTTQAITPTSPVSSTSPSGPTSNNKMPAWFIAGLIFFAISAVLAVVIGVLVFVQRRR
ncbi:MAG: InlB B-repeat-containing protein [Dehalococcoidia bacterium]|nr:InlB B-repeat-containing protein [Dehalococcoidia bacterium]